MILVTGGAGYIGSHVNKALAALGRETLVLDNLSNGHDSFAKWGVFEQADLLDAAALQQIFDIYPITGVMHFASFCYVRESMENPAKYYRNNLQGVLHLLDAMVAHDVPNIIFSSTCAVYGFATQVPLLEDHPLAPINPYGRSKRMIEQILADYSMAYGLQYACLRYFNAAGADPDCEIGEWHDPETHIIPVTLDAAMGKAPALTIHGGEHPTPDGTCIRDYIHVNDLATAHIKTLEYLEKGGESLAMNLGNGGGYSVRQVVETVERITGKSVPHSYGPANPGDPPQLVASAEHAKNLLDWRPKYPGLDAIVETAWAWHQRLYREFKQ